MQNVYLDPNSYVHLNNVVFAKDDRYNTNNCRAPYIYVKEYCEQNSFHLETIDRRGSNKSPEDIYVSFDHKFFLRRWYWKKKNSLYPSLDLSTFSKRILFQFEPPVVMPEIQYLESHILRVYDKAFFTWKVAHEKADYFHTPQAHAGIFPQYWQNENRGFATLIQSNRKPLSRYKELLSERIRAILFFGKTQDIDLYGFGWNEAPMFPYWFKKKAMQKVYKGSVKDKYHTLSRYTFAFAYENCELPGYITDKLFDCLYAGTIPVYLGAEDIAEYVPKDCFIHTRDFESYEKLKKFLKSLSAAQVSTYKENGRRFLESEQYKPFTKEHFAKAFLGACMS